MNESCIKVLVYCLMPSIFKRVCTGEVLSGLWLNFIKMSEGTIKTVLILEGKRFFLILDLRTNICIFCKLKILRIYIKLTKQSTKQQSLSIGISKFDKDRASYADFKNLAPLLMFSVVITVPSSISSKFYTQNKSRHMHKIHFNKK